ncbi:restriction endonuclease [Streptomyces anulatus]|uniref:restriction endonuclease n=1 Tax=Streptomyces anulatus TaxID=1892 RepID=UPI0038699E42|nr:restriction endonuclease [Streptomyces anulatus]
MEKKVNPLAYTALADALSLIFWYKKTLARFLRAALREYPELLVGLDLENDAKRDTAGALVAKLSGNERRYQDVTISLMIEIANMKSFRELEQLEDSQWIQRARNAVQDLKGLTQQNRRLVEEQSRFREELAEAVEKAENGNATRRALEALKEDFLVLISSTDPQARGRKFESFLNELFALFDLYPRAAYSLDREQIDGAFTFDTDDYILEAKWLKGPVSREQLDTFAKKVERKGRNALGLYVSVNGFTSDGLEEYKSASPFITMDGSDIFVVIDARVPLTDLFSRKKRHVNETGSCSFPATLMLSE